MFSITKHELTSYFRTPIAYVFLIAWLMLSLGAAFLVGDFFAFNEASVRTFLFWHPWLYVLFIPAVGMRLWAEERRQGTLELLLTYPITMKQAVSGKFLAGWLFLLIALLLTFPLVITLFFLGSPDVGATCSGYLGSLLMAGAFLSISACSSALTKNQVISFVISACICILFVLGGYEPVSLLFTKWGLPQGLSSAFASCSVIPHFENFQRGVLSLNDSFYFIGMIILFNALTLLFLQGQLGKTSTGFRRPAWQFLLVALDIIALSSILSHFSLAIDCTSDRLFSLSDGTRQVIADLDCPLTIDFYRTPSQPGLPAAYKTHIRRIDDLLTEYERQSNGKIIINRLTPVQDSPQEESALNAGILPQNVNPAKGTVLYLGLHFTQTGRRSMTIPFLNPLRASFLEFDITRTILKMTSKKRIQIAVLSPLRILGGVDRLNERATQPWALVDALKDSHYQLQPISEAADAIPDTADVLWLAHPEHLQPNTLKAIDRFIQQGKPVLACLDPVCWTLMNTRHATLRYAPNEASSLHPLTEAWGISFSEDKVLIDPQLATILINRQGTTVRHLDWLTATTSQFSSDRITSALTSLEFFKTGVFSGAPASGLTMTPLVSSSPEAQTFYAGMTFRSSQDLQADITPQHINYPIAVRLQGLFPSPYGPTGKPSTVILVGDVDFLHDAMAVQRGNHNLQFLLNIMDSLAGDNQLSEIRNRGNAVRPLTKMQEWEQAEELEYQERLEAFEKDYQHAKTFLLELEKQRTDQDDASLLSAKQREQFLSLKRQLADANRQLRTLRDQMRQKLEKIQFRIIAINILAIPLLLAITGTAVILRQRKGC